MKNFTETDYAANKFSSGIVYKFVNETVEINSDKFINQEPQSTLENFASLKALSDSIYENQSRKENAQTKKNISLFEQEFSPNIIVKALDEIYIEEHEQNRKTLLLQQFLTSSELTQTQKRRFILHYANQLSLREIADIEGVHYTSIDESIKSALDKSKKYFKKFGF